jgi:hypothetical protein
MLRFVAFDGNVTGCSVLCCAWRHHSLISPISTSKYPRGQRLSCRPTPDRSLMDWLAKSLLPGNSTRIDAKRGVAFYPPLFPISGHLQTAVNARWPEVGAFHPICLIARKADPFAGGSSRKSRPLQKGCGTKRTNNILYRELLCLPPPCRTLQGRSGCSAAP